MEKTLILIKPDGVQRKLIGEVVGRIERKNLMISEMKLMHLPKEVAEQHYAEHKEKPFFEELVSFMISGPLVALIVKGPNAVAVMRMMMGVTNPAEAAPGTIRGDYGLVVSENIIHGSDGSESAEREIRLFFPELN